MSAVALAVIGELAGRYLTGSFDGVRAIVILAVMLGVAAVAVVAMSRSPRRRVFIDLAFLCIGVVTIGVGLALSHPESLDDRSWEWVLRACLLVTGALVAGLAVFAVYGSLSGRDVDFLPLLDIVDGDPRTFREEGKPGAITKYAPLRGEHEAILSRFQRDISEEDLHFLAYYVDGKCLFSVDSLDHPSLDMYFHETPRATRRAMYERHGRQIIWLISALDRSLKRIQGGILVRTVLDVQFGAIYHFPIVRGVDLIGVTLIQEKVDVADAKLAALRDELSDLPRGGKLAGRKLSDRPLYQPAPAGILAGNPRRKSAGRANFALEAIRHPLPQQPPAPERT